MLFGLHSINTTEIYMTQSIQKILSKSTFYILAIVFISLIAACGNLDDIEIGDPKDVKIQGFEDNYLKLSTKIPVKNPSSYKITIKEIDVRVYLNGSYIGKLIIDENIEIKRKESREYDLPVKIRLNNVLGAAFIMMNMKQGQNVEIRFEGHVKAKTMLITREFPIDETKRIVI